MQYTFYAEDNEFAVSTGANVNDEPNKSSFDYPPNSTRDLVITADPGDTDTRLFEVGETYSVTWTGSGGGTITNATIVRSDDLDGPGTQGAVVFEGLDQNGDLAQVVWTPNFDLETWYFDNFVGGNPPKYWTTDQVAGDHHFACFVAGMRVDTAAGPVAVENLRPGDRVLTRDHGPQPVIWRASSLVPGIGRAAPVRISSGALGNEREILVSPQHRFLVDDLLAEVCFGQREVLVPARALVDGEKVQSLQFRQVEYHHILLEQHEILTVDGVATESMFLPDDARPLMDDAAMAGLRKMQERLGVTGPMTAARLLLSVQQGAVLRPALQLRRIPIPPKVPRLLIAG